MLIFFFFKQKKAYWKRICDRSSDVCSSDLEDGNECLYPTLGSESGPQRKTHSSRSRVGFQIVAIVVLELLEIVVDLKLGVFLRIRVRHAFGLVRRENGIAEGSFLLLASWLKGFVEFVRLRFLVELRRSEEHTSELQSLMRISY